MADRIEPSIDFTNNAVHSAGTVTAVDINTGGGPTAGATDSGPGVFITGGGNGIIATIVAPPCEGGHNGNAFRHGTPGTDPTERRPVTWARDAVLTTTNYPYY